MNERLSAARREREKLHASLVALEHAVAAPSTSPAWVEGVRSALKDAHSAFGSHIHVTEGDEGLFDEVVTASPRLAPAVQRLRNEHDEIEAKLDSVVLLLDSLDEPEQARAEVLSLLGWLARHRQRGADLVYEAYEVDIGGDNG